MRKWIFLFALGFLGLQAIAAGYPERPIKVIVPFPAGSCIDVGGADAQPLADRKDRPARDH